MGAEASLFDPWFDSAVGRNSLTYPGLSASRTVLILTPHSGREFLRPPKTFAALSTSVQLCFSAAIEAPPALPESEKRSRDQIHHFLSARRDSHPSLIRLSLRAIPPQ